MTGTVLTPILGLIGIVAAAAFGAFGKEWYQERRLRQKAASPTGKAEAEAIKLAVSLDREKWLDQQTRGLFDNVHEQLERALAELDQLRSKVHELSDEVSRVTLMAITADRKRVEAERQRDEMRDLVETIQRGRG